MSSPMTTHNPPHDLPHDWRPRPWIWPWIKQELKIVMSGQFRTLAMFSWKDRGYPRAARGAVDNCICLCIYICIYFFVLHTQGQQGLHRGELHRQGEQRQQPRRLAGQEPRRRGQTEPERGNIRGCSHIQRQGRTEPKREEYVWKSHHQHSRQICCQKNFFQKVTF